MTAAVNVGRHHPLTAHDHAVAAEWGLTLRPARSTRAGQFTGIYCGLSKLADYCHDTMRMTAGREPRHAETMFDAIVAIGNQAAEWSS